MIGVEVSLRGLELLTLANVDDRLTQSLGVPGFPVCARIVVGEIDDHKRAVPNLGPHKIVDDSRSRNVPHVKKLVANSIPNAWLDNFLHEPVEQLVAEFHRDEASVARKLPPLCRLIALPPIEG